MNKPALVSSRGSVLTSPNAVAFAYGSLDQAFPNIDPGIKPFGANVTVQIRHPMRRSKGGIELSGEARKTEHYNTQVAKVVALGPLCFMTVKEVPADIGQVPRDVLVPYVEGPWFEIGDYVRVPKYGGDRFTVDYTYIDYILTPDGHREKETITDDLVFANFKAREIIGLYIGNPLAVKAYID